MKKAAAGVYVFATFATFLHSGSLRVIANPPERSYACMVTDSLNNRIILSGGGVAWSRYYNDVWVLDCATEQWTQICTTGTVPAPRFMASAAYLPDSNSMILIGGRTYSSYFDEVWVLKLAPGAEHWLRVTAGGIHPSARSSSSCIIDPVNDRAIIFGGECNSVFFNDVWSLDLNTWNWSALSPSGTTPTPRFEHSAIYDPLYHRMIVFGGYDGTHYNDVWALDLEAGLETWSQLYPTGSPPDPRGRHFCVYDRANTSMIIGFGYGDGFYYLNDAWALNLDPLEWTCINSGPNGVAGRRGACAAYNPLNQETVIFGGDQGSGPTNSSGDTYSLKTGITGIETGNSLPDPRSISIHFASNPSTQPFRCAVSVVHAVTVDLSIFEDSGRRVATLYSGIIEPGIDRVFKWNGRDSRGRVAAPGVYFVQLTSGTEIICKKAVIIE